MPYKRFRLSDEITLIQETGVANFMRCNIWHVRGRDFDLIIDTGMGLDPLKQWITADTKKPLKAMVTHCHFDHSGCLHEFDVRLGHRAEADILANPSNKQVVFDGAWQRISIVDLKQHPSYKPESYSITPAPLTGYLDEGDFIDLGNKAYQVLHLPGHSPGSIGLWDIKSKVLFSGDALYDGELLDSLYHSDKQVYLQTLARLEEIDVEVIHAGHYPSFGKARMQELISSYELGKNSLSDVEEWYNSQSGLDNIYDDQNWSSFQVL